MLSGPLLPAQIDPTDHGQSTNELKKELVSRRVRSSSLNRRVFGGDTDMVAIACAIQQAELGYMADITDLMAESFLLDLHMSSCAHKRFAPVAAADWDVTPAQAVERGDRRTAIEIADAVRDVLTRLDIAGVNELTAWAESANRAAHEVRWAAGAWGYKFAPYALEWIHPRDLSYGCHRQLLYVDPTNAGGFMADRGIPIEETPGKFLFSKPRLFNEHHEREGLGPRSMFWAFFKRFGWRMMMKLIECWGMPWRIITIDAKDGVVANSESIERIRDEVEDLSGEGTATLDQGVGLEVEWPGENSGALFKMNLETVNGEQSKMWNGSVGTGDLDATRANGIIGKGEQDVIFQRTCARVDRAWVPVVRTFVEQNWGRGAVHLAPKFQIRAQPQRDRDKELARVRVFLGLGMTVAESEAREIAGFRVPIEDEKYLAMSSGGSVDAMGNVLPGAVEVVDPTKPSPAVAPASATAPALAAPPEEGQEAEGVDGLHEDAARALKDMLGLTARGAVCCANEVGKTVPANAVYGSPETLVARGVKEGSRASSRWTAQLQEAVAGLSDAVSIRRAINAVELDVEPFARAVEKGLVHGAMLGALDAEWEAENDRVVKPPVFSIELGRLENEDERIDRIGARSPFLLAGGVVDFVASPFAEAIRLFKKRAVVSRRAFDRLAAQAKQRAFTVANLASNDVIGVVKDELTKALEEGDDLRRFSARLAERTETAGWVTANPSHVENVFRTNTMGAYSRGREEQMNQPSVIAARPYRQALGVKDSRTRPAHRAAHGKVIRHDDPSMARLRTPWGFMCRDRWVSRSERDVERLGLEVVSGASLTGLPDEGWDGPGGF